MAESVSAASSKSSPITANASIGRATADLHAYLDGTSVASDPQGPLFRTLGRGTGLLTRTPLPQANAYAMIQRRARAAGICTRIGNHTFRAIGIMAYPEERWHARKGGDDRQPRLDPHNPALRPPQRRGQLGRGRADLDLILATCDCGDLSFPEWGAGDRA